MRTFPAPVALSLLALLAGLSVGTAGAQTPSPRRAAPPQPAPQGAALTLPGQTQVDGAANAANLWVNQAIGRILDGTPVDGGGPARPNR